MKKIFIFFVFTLLVQADYLNTKTKNICIYDVEPYVNHKGLCYVKRKNNQSFCNTKLKYKDLIDGYERKAGKCVLKNDLALTGLTQSEWNYLMAFLAHAVGFTFFFLSTYLVNLIARK